MNSNNILEVVSDGTITTKGPKFEKKKLYKMAC